MGDLTTQCPIFHSGQSHDPRMPRVDFEDRFRGAVDTTGGAEQVLSLMVPASTTSATRSRTRSQPRSLLSIARLNIAKSRTQCLCCSRVLIAQMWRGFSVTQLPSVTPP